MPQFVISHETHLNTVLIAGLICHISVFLQHAEDIDFLKPLTLVYYDPSALKGKLFPALHTPQYEPPNTFQNIEVFSHSITSSGPIIVRVIIYTYNYRYTI